MTRNVSGQRRSLQIHIPMRPPKARHTGKPRSPTSKYPLLQVLEGRSRLVLGVPGKMDLAVFAEELAVRAHQDRGVESSQTALLLRELRIAEMETDRKPPGLVEERSGGLVWHLALEVAVDLGLLLHEIPREEGREGQLRENHEPAVRAMRFPKELDEPPHDRASRLVPLDRAELRGGHFEIPRHQKTSSAPNLAASWDSGDG